MKRHSLPSALANPQMRTVQKLIPILYAFIYLVVPGAVVLYMIVSSGTRIATQSILSRKGPADPPPSAVAV